MKIEQLEQLVAIHAHSTISAAADALFISQPTVSRSMQALEAELGYPLLERSRNRVRLNEAGLVALTHAQRVLDDTFRRCATLSQTRRAGYAPSALVAARLPPSGSSRVGSCHPSRE